MQAAQEVNRKSVVVGSGGAARRQKRGLCQLVGVGGRGAGEGGGIDGLVPHSSPYSHT